MKGSKVIAGFTLVEIMIVVAIIAVLAAVAIPNLLRARLSANETSAEAALRAIHTAAESYRSVNNAYPPDLAVLATAVPPYIDSHLGNGSKHGYAFSLNSTAYTFIASARPEIYGVTGERSFMVDESAVIRYTNQNAAATVDDLPITP